MKFRLAVVIILLLAFCGNAASQPSGLPPISGSPGGTVETAYFNIIIDPDEYAKAGEEETDDIRFLSLLTAYGIVHGIDWRIIPTEEDIIIEEKVYSIVDGVELQEMTEIGDCFRYNYAYEYLDTELDEAHVGRPLEATGESDEKNMALAWDEARQIAFTSIVEQALAREYTENQLAIPPSLAGMITTYEIIFDDYSYLDEVYRFQIKAWANFETRVTEFLK